MKARGQFIAKSPNAIIAYNLEFLSLSYDLRIFNSGLTKSNRY